MRMRLVPVSCGSDIILTFKKTSVADTNLLQSYLKVLLKKDRIKKVPAVEATLRHLIIIVVIIMKEGIVARVVRIAKIRSTVLIFNGLAILLCCKAPGTAEVIFCSGSANGWIFLLHRCRISSHLLRTSSVRGWSVQDKFQRTGLSL